MADKKIFVGRKDELEQFGKVLEDPKGQAVFVVGQAGMGKTWLTHKMAEVAENHPDLKCGWVRYEITPTDSVDSAMALMMDNAFEAAQVTEGSFDGTERRLEQWRSFLNVFNIGNLAMSLRRAPQRNTREQFLKRLELVSERMPKDGRAVFIIDPEKYMQEKNDQSWAIVAKQLPEKIKFAEVQWRKVCDVSVEVMKMLEAYAVLEVGVPDDVVEAVSGLGATKMKRLQKDKYLHGLLRKEEEGLRIYHTILADYIVG
jgi:KaiC/GvpD/RAD55 family RecA-like ATPase